MKNIVTNMSDTQLRKYAAEKLDRNLFKTIFDNEIPFTKASVEHINKQKNILKKKRRKALASKKKK